MPEQRKIIEKPILEVKDVHHAYGRFKVLHGITLQVDPGSLTALIGPNGAGKTTFYNVVSGRHRPTRGEIYFNGRKISGRPVHGIVPLGLLRSFQITNIFPDLTVIDNVMVPLLLQHKMGYSFLRALSGKKKLYRRAEEILGQVGILSAAYRPANELAYGDKRLVEIAIVLARDPKLVLLDEPTAGMNPEETDRMVRLIKQLSGHLGTTFFLTEHDMNVVFSVASHLFVLHQGALLAAGPPEVIKADQAVKEAYLGGSIDAQG